MLVTCAFGYACTHHAHAWGARCKMHCEVCLSTCHCIHNIVTYRLGSGSCYHMAVWRHTHAASYAYGIVMCPTQRSCTQRVGTCHCPHAYQRLCPCTPAPSYLCRFHALKNAHPARHVDDIFFVSSMPHAAIRTSSCLRASVCGSGAIAWKMSAGSGRSLHGIGLYYVSIIPSCLPDVCNTASSR